MRKVQSDLSLIFDDIQAASSENLLRKLRNVSQTPLLSLEQADRLDMELTCFYDAVGSANRTGCPTQMRSPCWRERVLTANRKK